jgi:hypothetical protein
MPKCYNEGCDHAVQKGRLYCECCTNGEGECQKFVPEPEVEDEFELDYCEECVQMTNHKDGECQKCKVKS